MKNSTTPKKDSRSMFARFGKITAALAFGGMLCAFPMSSARAAYHHGGGGRGHAVHGGYHGGGYHGGGHWGGGYYAPGPDYYVAPEPYAYSGPGPCYGPDGEYDCGEPPPSGINLFFGL
jgi:hypothetical protein